MLPTEQDDKDRLPSSSPTVHCCIGRRGQRRERDGEECEDIVNSYEHKMSRISKGLEGHLEISMHVVFFLVEINYWN